MSTQPATLGRGGRGGGFQEPFKASQPDGFSGQMMRAQAAGGFTHGDLRE